MGERMTDLARQKRHAAEVREANDRRIWDHDASGQRADVRTERRQARMSARDRLPPAGEWRVVGDLRDVDAWLNAHVAIVRRARGGYAVAGHYRQAHVEAGPFARTVEARQAWNRMRPELEAFRVARHAARREGRPWPPAGAGGTGWAAQAGWAGRCPECARRVAARAAPERVPGRPVAPPGRAG